MRNKWFLFIWIYSIAFLTINCDKKNDFPVLKDSYLGQKPPGIIPEIFAPGVISTELGEMCSIFSMDGKKFLFLRYDKTKSPRINTIFITELKDGVWTNLKSLSFNKKFFEWDYNFAADNRTLYYTSLQPVKINGMKSECSNIWKSKINDSNWTDPQVIGYPINTAESNDQFPSFTKTGTMYFFSNRKSGFGKSDIFCARLIDGKYPEVKNLGSVINTEYSEFDLYISPDESYLIFCSNRPGGYTSNDIYITYRYNNGSWSAPKNLGEKINTIGGVCPNVSPDKKYFFFTGGKNSAGSDIYWVDAKFIEELKPDILKKGIHYNEK